MFESTVNTNTKELNSVDISAVPTGRPALRLFFQSCQLMSLIIILYDTSRILSRGKNMFTLNRCFHNGNRLSEMLEVIPSYVKRSCIKQIIRPKGM